MVKITTPVEGFTGTVAGVDFADGVGHTDDPGAVAYFARHGYGIEAGRKTADKAPADPGEPASPAAKKTAAKKTAAPAADATPPDGDAGDASADA